MCATVPATAPPCKVTYLSDYDIMEYFTSETSICQHNYSALWINECEDVI